jgi:hypothetical protein
MLYIHIKAKAMKENNKLKEKWIAQIRNLWPAVKGSLALVNKPCIRKSCPACASGKKHPAWILSVVVDGRRSSRYVPEAYVPQIKQAITNGRKIEELLQLAAIEMIEYHRDSVIKSNKPSSKS